VTNGDRGAGGPAEAACPVAEQNHQVVRAAVRDGEVGVSVAVQIGGRQEHGPSPVGTRPLGANETGACPVA
jgi:hypothetical protein